MVSRYDYLVKTFDYYFDLNDEKCYGSTSQSKALNEELAINRAQDQHEKTGKYVEVFQLNRKHTGGTVIQSFGEREVCADSGRK